MQSPKSDNKRENENEEKSFINLFRKFYDDIDIYFINTQLEILINPLMCVCVCLCSRALVLLLRLETLLQNFSLQNTGDFSVTLCLAHYVSNLNYRFLICSVT